MKIGLPGPWTIIAAVWVTGTIIALLAAYVWYSIIITDGWALAVYGSWWYKITSTVSGFCKKTSKRLYWWWYDVRVKLSYCAAELKRKMRT